MQITIEYRLKNGIKKKKTFMKVSVEEALKYYHSRYPHQILSVVTDEHTSEKDPPKVRVKKYEGRKVNSPWSRAVSTPYGYFTSIIDCAKYIYDNDARMRNHWGGLHTYNTIVNLRNMVSTRCHSALYVDWIFYE